MPQLGAGPILPKRITQTLFTGIFAILPLGLTIAVLAWVTRFLHDLAGPQSTFGKALRSIGMTITACEVTAYMIGLVGAVTLVYGLGVLVENRIGRRLNIAMDGALQKIPILSTLYDASKSLTSVFDRREDSLQGMTPVMCYFGNNSDVTIPALMPTPELVRFAGHEYHVVIIPSAPVPFGGALVCVRADWVRPAECSFDELIGIYMSMGSSAPGCLGDGNFGSDKRADASSGFVTPAERNH
jgi:uncharacterized membrane protein